MNASRNVLFAVLLTLGCATSTTSEEASVRQAMMGFMNALNALDADRMESFFADDITAFVPTAQPDRVDGRAAVSRIFRDFVARAGTTRLNLVPEDMRVEVSGDLGVVTFNVRGSVTRRRTFIFRRVGDRWLISHFHASDLAKKTSQIDVELARRRYAMIGVES